MTNSARIRYLWKGMSKKKPLSDSELLKKYAEKNNPNFSKDLRRALNYVPPKKSDPPKKK